MSDDIVKTLLESLTDEQKAQLVQGLLKSNESDEVLWVNPELKEETVSSKPRSRNVTEDFRMVNDNTLEKRKTPVRARKNQWVDEGEDRDPDFDPAKFERMGKATRNRGKVRKETVECHVCGKTFSINPSLIYGTNIRCNRCTGR
tara:strand:+ start:185 stop:619 length:435 start_codon:yes stop_codon:yes gene_type:complete